MKLFAQLAVPNRDPVKDPKKELPVTLVSTNNEFKDASDPDTITFFQLGILYESYFFLWLDTHTYAVRAPTSLFGPTELLLL